MLCMLAVMVALNIIMMTIDWNDGDGDILLYDGGGNGVARYGQNCKYVVAYTVAQGKTIEYLIQDTDFRKHVMAVIKTFCVK